MIVAVQVCKILLSYMYPGHIQKIFTLCKQPVFWTEFIHPWRLHQSTSCPPQNRVLKCYFTYFFILLPFFCNLSFCSLSSTLKLTFILFFYGPVSLLLGTCPCTDFSGFTQLLLFCLCQPQLSSLQALSSLSSWSFHISPVPCSFLLKTISDTV